MIFSRVSRTSSEITLPRNSEHPFILWQKLKLTVLSSALENLETNEYPGTSHGTSSRRCIRLSMTVLSFSAALNRNKYMEARATDGAVRTCGEMENAKLVL